MTDLVWIGTLPTIVGDRGDRAAGGEHIAGGGDADCVGGLVGRAGPSPRNLSIQIVSLATLGNANRWGRVAATTGPVAPKADTFGASSRLLLLPSPSHGRFRHSNREDG